MKILILTSKFGMGHYSAAKAMEEKLLSHYKGMESTSLDLKDYQMWSPLKVAKDFWEELTKVDFSKDAQEKELDENALLWQELENTWANTAPSNQVEEVKIVDIFELAYPEYIDILYKGYGFVIEKGAKIYNLIYKKSSEVTPSQSKSLELVYNHVLGRVAKLLFKEKPDVIISAHSICSEVVSDYKKLSGSTIPLVTAITDIEPHTTWINEATNYYLVAAQKTKDQLMARGVEQNKIRIVGMPLHHKFEELKQQRLAAEAAQISGNDQLAQFTAQNIDQNTAQPANQPQPQTGLTQYTPRKLLIMGGGLGLIPTDPEFYQALDNLEHVQTTVITGKNTKLYNKLQGEYTNVQIIGFTDKVLELMTDAHLLLSKSGGITTFESMYCSLPMAIFKPFLEQEISNGEFIKENNMGIILKDKMEDALLSMEDLVGLLFDEPLLLEMQRNMKAIVDNINEDGIIEVMDEIIHCLGQESDQDKRKSRLKPIHPFE